jgi:hypothetical protein
MRRKFPTDQVTAAPYADSSGAGSASPAAPAGPRRFPLLGRKVQGVCLAVGVTLIVPVSALSALALPPSAVKRLAGSVLTVPADIFRGDEAISELQAASDRGPLALGTAYLTSSRVGEALEAAANSDAGEELALASGDAEASPDDALLSELEAPTGTAEQPPASDDTGEQGGGGQSGEPGKGHSQGKSQGNGNGSGNGQGNGNGNGQGNGNGDDDGGEDDGDPGSDQGNGEGNGNGDDEQGNGNGDHGQGNGHGSEEGPGQGQGNDNENGPGNGNGQGQDAPFTAPEPDLDPSDQSVGSEKESEPAGNQGDQEPSGSGQNGNGQGKGPKN